MSPGEDAGPGDVDALAVDAATSVDASAGIDAGPGVLTADATTYSYGAIAPGQSPSHTFGVTNTGAMRTGPVAVSIGGADATAFTLDAGGCQGMSLDPGDGCSVKVTFATDTVATKHASLTFMGSPGGSATVALDGSGLSPAALSADPPSLSFGPVTIGGSAALDVTIHNGGAVATGSLGRTVSGPNASAFTTRDDMCSGQPLDAGASCKVTVVFAPTSSGDLSASLSVGDGDKSAEVPLAGKGVTPGSIMLSPGSIGFGTVALGSSASHTLTVKNVGGATLTSLATLIHGTDAAAFSASPDGCAGKDLGGGASCTILVVFAPGATGDRSASITVSADSGASASDTLTGTGKAHRTVVADTTWCGGLVTSTSGLINCGSTCDGDVTTETIT